MSYHERIFMYVLKNISTIAELKGTKNKVTELPKQLG